MSDLISPNNFPAEDELITKQTIRNSDLNTDSSNYFIVSPPLESSKEWLDLIDTENFMLDISTDHSFKITLGLRYAHFMEAEDDLNVAKVILGIKDSHKTYRSCIELGLYMGRLFIGDKFDIVSVGKEYLIEGVKLVLTVHREENDGSYAVLNVISEYGLIISSLVSRKIPFEDWKGEISPGAHFKSLVIESVPDV